MQSGAARATTYTLSGRQIKCVSSGQEKLQLLAADLGQRTLVLAENRVGQVALRALKLQDLLFDRALRHESRRDHVPLLPDAVSAIDRLGFDSWIPPWVE